LASCKHHYYSNCASIHLEIDAIKRGRGRGPNGRRNNKDASSGDRKSVERPHRSTLPSSMLHLSRKRSLHPLSQAKKIGKRTSGTSFIKEVALDPLTRWPRSERKDLISLLAHSDSSSLKQVSTAFHQLVSEPFRISPLAVARLC